MATGQSKPKSGREAFLAQRARLSASLANARANDTASRFNRLDETQRKVVFMLANAASQRFKALPQLTRNQLGNSIESFSEQERRSLMLGIKHLAELAAAIPWEFLDIAAPHHEMQAQRDKPPAAETTIN